MERMKCINNPDIFCYSYGEFMIKNQWQPIKMVYDEYFGIRLRDPDKVCRICVFYLRNWLKGKKSLSFGIPME